MTILPSEYAPARFLSLIWKIEFTKEAGIPLLKVQYSAPP